MLIFNHGCQNSVVVVTSMLSCQDDYGIFPGKGVFLGKVSKFGGHRLNVFDVIKLFSGGRGGYVRFKSPPV